MARELYVIFSVSTADSRFWLAQRAGHFLLQWKYFNWNNYNISTEGQKTIIIKIIIIIITDLYSAFRPKKLRTGTFLLQNHYELFFF